MASTIDLPGQPGVRIGAAGAVHGRETLLSLVVGTALLFAHRRALAGMIAVWNASPMYSYGWTVPVISLYLLWTQRARLSMLTPKPSLAAGAAAATIAVLMTAGARAGGIQVFEQLAFLVSLTACALLLFGWSYVRIAWPALAYLLLMIPMWDGLTEPLHERFQLQSAAIGAWLLQMIGVPAYREGMLITLPALKIEVARACSGVNYLVAVIALGLPLCYLYLPQLWRRIVLLLAAVTVAGLSNGLRVALIGLLAHLDIGSPLHGPFHVLHGLFVAGIGYVVLFAGLRLLTPKGTKSPLAGETTQHNHEVNVRTPRTISTAVAAAGLTALFVMVGSNAFPRASQAVALTNGSSALPSRLGTWESAGELTREEIASTNWAGADTELRRRYRHAEGAVVDVYVGYFAAQAQGREIVNRRAAALHARATTIDLVRGDGAAFRANLARPEDGEAEELFWYDLGAGPETNRYIVKAQTLWKAVWRGRSNGAVIVLTVRNPGRSADRVLQELAPLVADALANRLSSERTAGL